MNNIEENIKNLILEENSKRCIEKKETNQKQIFEIDMKLICSRCGGKHFDLSCIYYKN